MLAVNVRGSSISLHFLLVEISWIASNHVPLYTKTIEDRPLSTYFNKTSSLADQKALFSPRRDAFACNYQILIYSWRSYGHVKLQSSLLHSCYCITRQAVGLLIFIQLNWDWPFHQHKTEKHQPPWFFLFAKWSLHAAGCHWQKYWIRCRSRAQFVHNSVQIL